MVRKAEERNQEADPGSGGAYGQWVVRLETEICLAHSGVDHGTEPGPTL